MTADAARDGERAMTVKRLALTLADEMNGWMFDGNEQVEAVNRVADNSLDVCFTSGVRLNVKVYDIGGPT